MLSLMRKHATSWLIKIILGAIVIVFVLWGVGSWTSQRSGRVASVNGEIITVDEYRDAYKRLIDQVRQSFGNNFNDEILKSLQLDKQALNQIIDKYVMLQAASELDMRVSDEELSHSIRNIDAFQTAGVFDPRRYQGILNRNNWTPETFENIQRDALLIEKLTNFIVGNVKVSDNEALDWYLYNNAEVDLDFLLVNADRYTDIAVTPKEIKDYFEANKESYKTEPAVKVRYVKFDPKDLLGKVEISDNEIQEYYNFNSDEFQNPKTVEARHILIKVAKDAPPEKVDEARKRIEDILQKARGGQNFAELAKQYSEGPTKDKGGYLGTFRKDSMVKPFADKAFSMKAGEISEPVRTQFGWHLIEVEKVNEAGKTPLADAKEGIRKKLADQRAKQMAYDEAESVFNDAFDRGKLDEIAAERNLEIITTDLFTRREPPENIPDKAAFAKAAFDLPPGQVSEILDIGDGFYLLEMVERREPRIPEISEVEEQVKTDLIQKRKFDKAKTDAEAVLADLKDGASMETVARDYNLTLQTTGFFERNGSIPNIGFEREISQAAFDLSQKNSLPRKVSQGKNGFYVIKFKQRKTPSMDEFKAGKEAVEERLLRQKQSSVIKAWLEQKKKDCEIIIEENSLKS